MVLAVKALIFFLEAQTSKWGMFGLTAFVFPRNRYMWGALLFWKGLNTCLLMGSDLSHLFWLELKGGCTEDRAGLLSLLLSARTRSNRHNWSTGGSLWPSGSNSVLCRWWSDGTRTQSLRGLSLEISKSCLDLVLSPCSAYPCWSRGRDKWTQRSWQPQPSCDYLPAAVKGNAGTNLQLNVEASFISFN